MTILHISVVVGSTTMLIWVKIVATRRRGGRYGRQDNRHGKNELAAVPQMSRIHSKLLYSLWTQRGKNPKAPSQGDGLHTDGVGWARSVHHQQRKLVKRRDNRPSSSCCCHHCYFRVGFLSVLGTLSVEGSSLTWVEIMKPESRMLHQAELMIKQMSGCILGWISYESWKAAV